LALKSLLRIYENSPADSFGCAEGVRQLLDRFVQENDDQLLELVRSSGYFQFFSDSIDAIVSESDVGFSRQSVAQIP
jgi:hypothetical protein